MSQGSEPSGTPKKGQAVNNIALFSVGAQVGCVTLVIVFLSLFIGIGLDKLLGTKPIFIILFVLGSAPLSIYITYKLAMRAVKGAIPQEPAGKPKQPVKEEDKGE
jgi:F0F1-type ATP synthase assembly protein I